jgi:hypothetical protein
VSASKGPTKTSINTGGITRLFLACNRDAAQSYRIFSGFNLRNWQTEWLRVRQNG